MAFFSQLIAELKSVKDFCPFYMKEEISMVSKKDNANSCFFCFFGEEFFYFDKKKDRFVCTGLIYSYVLMFFYMSLLEGRGIRGILCIMTLVQQ